MASPKVDARAISGTPPRSLVRFYQRITRAVFRVQETEGGKGEEKGERGEAVECPLASKTRSGTGRRKVGRMHDSLRASSSKMLFRFCSSSPPCSTERWRKREEPSWMRSTGQKIHDPFSVRAPPPPTQLGNGHEGWIRAQTASP